MGVPKRMPVTLAKTVALAPLQYAPRQVHSSGFSQWLPCAVLCYVAIITLVPFLWVASFTMRAY